MMVRAQTAYPFEGNSLEIDGPTKGDAVDVWFLPTGKVEQEGNQMIRVRMVSMPVLEWWVPVKDVTLLPLEGN